MSTLATEINCSASITEGILTLENGAEIDLGVLQRALKTIAETRAHWRSEPDEIAVALTDAICVAKHALMEFQNL